MIQVHNHGSIFVLQPTTDTEAAWLAEHAPEDAQWWGANGLVVEHRYVDFWIEQAIEQGLDVGIS